MTKVSVAAGAVALHDLLTMLGVDPDDSPDGRSTTAEVLAAAVLSAAVRETRLGSDVADLSRSLVDAATKAIGEARREAVQAYIWTHSDGTQDMLDPAEVSTVIHEPDPATVGGRAAVTAVLRELADSYPNEPVTNATPEVAAELYALANEVEGVR